LALNAIGYFVVLWVESAFAMFPQVYKFGEMDRSSWVAKMGALMCFATICTVDPICKTLYQWWHTKKHNEDDDKFKFMPTDSLDRKEQPVFTSAQLFRGDTTIDNSVTLRNQLSGITTRRSMTRTIF